MQGNQWKAASKQLLKHWQRCGISHIPNTTTLSETSTLSWLTENASVLYENAELDGSSVVYESTDRSSSQEAREDSSSTQTLKSPSTMASMPIENSTSSTESQRWNSSSLLISERTSFLNALNDQVVACRKCEDIVCNRQRTVFGVGAIDARIVMFGEAPGADEDRQGEPFVGAAGQLLDKILGASGLKRAEVYILNALKCRPPNNRTPTEIEIENCRPFFESQLEIIRPEYIVCWGAVAVRAVLRSTESIGRLRGKFHDFRGAKVMVTYHPAYLLRNPDAKRLTWDDMKMLIKEMGLQIPGKNG